MKNNVTIAVLGITTAVTLVGTLTAPTVVHQIAVFAGGSFSVLVALAVCVAANIGSDSTIKLVAAGEAGKGSTSYAGRPPLPDDVLVKAVHALREGNFSDWAIAHTLNVDIDVVSTIK